MLRFVPAPRELEKRIFPVPAVDPNPPPALP